MTVQLSYPGVYIHEIPSGVRTITRVATSTTAFVGRTERGPTDQPVVVTNFGDFERTYGGLWSGSQLGFAVRDFFTNGGSTAVIARLYRAETGGGASPAKASLSINTLELEAAEEGAWGNQLRARVDHDTRPHDGSLGETPTSLFNLYVRDGTTGRIEAHRNLTVDPDHPAYVTDVLADSSKLVRATGHGTNRPPAKNDHCDPGDDIWTNAPPPSAWVAPVDEASDGLVLTDAEFVGPGRQAAKTGLYLLERADLFNLLVIPPYRTDQTVDTAVTTAAAAYVEQRRAVLLVDPLPTWKEPGDIAGEALAAALGTNSKNAALYFPRLRQPNPLKDNQVETFAPSGMVAGVLARTDAKHGVWKAPAGVDATLKGAPELSVSLTDDEIGQLNPIGVNCLRTAPTAGPVVWGARTMQGTDHLASEWKYLPVRRTALMIEESLYRGTRWAVFEPNDEALWAQIRLNIGTFMDDLFRQGAFQGTTPRDAYFVRCDRTTMTPSDIDLGVVNILVGFAPLKPAEFVVVSLQQVAGQSSA